jgi:TonB family protein
MKSVQVLALAVLSGSTLVGKAAPAAESALPTVAVAPRYPEVARAARVHGVVALTLEIDSTGATKVGEVTRTVPVLVDAAREAARSWRFAAGTATPQAVVFEFVLEGGSDPDTYPSPRVEFLPPLKVRVVATAPALRSSPSRGSARE